MTASPKKTKPLSALGSRLSALGSRLPAPGSRLPAPGSPESALTDERSAARKQRRDRWLAGLVVAGACGFSFWLAYPNQPLQPPPNGGLVVDEKELDFGEVWEDSAFPWKFTIRNPTDKEVEIKKFWTSCSCAAVKPEATVVPARGDAQLVVVVDLSAAFRDPPEVPAFEDAPNKRAFEAYVVPEMERPDSQVDSKGWRIRGQVSRILTFSPASVALGEISPAKGPATHQRVRIIAHAPVSNLGVTGFPGRFGELKVTRSSSRANEWDMSIDLARDLPPGFFEVTSTIKPIGPGIPESAKSCFVVQGRVLNDLQATPPAINFGARTVGEIAGESLRIHSLGLAQFRVMDCRATCKDIAVEPAFASNRFAEVAEFNIRQQITRTGQQGATIAFEVETREGKKIKIAIPTQYYGLKP